jgi:c(7)-type cytochrome triheme protein
VSEVRILSALIALVVVLAFVGGAVAVPPGKTVEWDGKGAGKVVFDGKVHADKGNKCNDCHTKLFQMKKGTAEMKMEDMNAKKQCGACHDGTKAFDASDKASCDKCHKKQSTP